MEPDFEDRHEKFYYSTWNCRNHVPILVKYLKRWGSNLHHLRPDLRPWAFGFLAVPKDATKLSWSSAQIFGWNLEPGLKSESPQTTKPFPKRDSKIAQENGRRRNQRWPVILSIFSITSFLNKCFFIVTKRALLGYGPNTISENSSLSRFFSVTLGTRMHWKIEESPWYDWDMYLWPWVTRKGKEGNEMAYSDLSCKRYAIHMSQPWNFCFCVY